jgi:hypothetical protein
MDATETSVYATQLLDHPPKTIVDLGIYTKLVFSYLRRYSIVR